MGVNIPDSDFACIDVLRELEKCRNREPQEEKKEDNNNVEIQKELEVG